MNRNNDEVISDAKFLGFNWPPKMPSYRFKKRKNYVHEVEVVSVKDPSLVLLLVFPSEPKAKNAMKGMSQAKNNVSITYNRREVPVSDSREFID